MKRPHVLWIMSDQHNARCTGYAGHPDVRTPALDRIAARGVHFENAFCNSPICAPSRVSFMTGQYCHTHRLFSNDNRWVQDGNPNTLASLFQRYGYQTGLVGKSHMVPAWDRASFEFIRYTDLIDADLDNPLTNHYFAYLESQGLADYYGEGSAKRNQEGRIDGSVPGPLPYEHTIEHYTGEQSLAFLKARDTARPFFLKMSFQRPHDPITPAPEYFDMYDPGALTLPDNAGDWFENQFDGKPSFMRKRLLGGSVYPLAAEEPARLRRALASYYALITEMDTELGRVLDHLETQGLLDNTVILYTADHGDFAGEHGLFAKNLGLYDSIHRTPFLLSWPGGRRGTIRRDIVESVDWFPTLCGICNVPCVAGVDGTDLLAKRREEKDAAFCEWNDCSAIRTYEWRLVLYRHSTEGELYDQRNDPGETRNLWNDAGTQGVRLELVERLLRFTMGYARRTGPGTFVHAPTTLVQFGGCYWSDLKQAYANRGTWPPGSGQRSAAQLQIEVLAGSAGRGPEAIVRKPRAGHLG